ncbi:MAG: periplasmic heavy metal sensor [Pseudomonadota bacterium]
MARLFERLPSLRASLPWILFALSLTLNVFFLGGYYYKRVVDQQLAGNEQERGRYIAEQLRFTPEQRKRFQDMRQSARERGRETFRENRPLIDNLWREIEKPQPDPSALDGYIDHLTANRAAFQREQMRDLLGFAKTLDESQRVEFLELVRTRLERGAMIPRRPERPAR